MYNNDLKKSVGSSFVSSVCFFISDSCIVYMKMNPPTNSFKFISLPWRKMTFIFQLVFTNQFWVVEAPPLRGIFRSSLKYPFEYVPVIGLIWDGNPCFYINWGHPTLSSLPFQHLKKYTNTLNRQSNNRHFHKPRKYRGIKSSNVSRNQRYQDSLWEFITYYCSARYRTKNYWKLLLHFATQFARIQSVNSQLWNTRCNYYNSIKKNFTTCSRNEYYH